MNFVSTTNISETDKNGTKKRPFGMFFLPRRGCRIQPRVSTLGNIQEKRFALKGREITWAKCVRLLPKRKRVFVRQRDNLPMAKIMRTSTKWSDCGP